MSTPRLQLETLYLLDDERIRGTREAEPSPGPLFALIRGPASCAWAVRSDVAPDVARELERLAREEQPAADVRDAPMHANRYTALVAGTVDAGPSFGFPTSIAQPADAVLINAVESLDHHFSGWTAGELPACGPIVGVLVDGQVVSVCFSARRSDAAAEAGVETAAAFRGRGLAPRVTAAWACAVRATGLTPLYSTSWSNKASLAVARKLRLKAYASTWSVS